jgi:hypothetical protein
VDAADRDDLVPDREALQELLLRPALALLGPDQQEVEDPRHHHEEEQDREAAPAGRARAGSEEGDG